MGMGTLSGWSESGADFWTGHKDTEMLMRYTYLRAKDLVGGVGVVTANTRLAPALCT